MLGIEIMYDGKDAGGKFVRQRVPIDEISTLPNTGVLFITLSTEWGNRSALVARTFSRFNSEGKKWYGDDNYAIGFIAGRFFVKQWSDEDEYILTRSLADPLSTVYEKHPIKQQLWPPEAVVHRFRGALLPMDEWNAALKIFETEMF